jgi:hypothetical protein
MGKCADCGDILADGVERCAPCETASHYASGEGAGFIQKQLLGLYRPPHRNDPAKSVFEWPEEVTQPKQRTDKPTF